MRRPAIAVAAWLCALLMPGGVAAHGLDEDATDRTTLEYIPLGIEHMALGWDHLLFIAGILLISKTWQTAAKLVTVFVVGHSLTLLIATLSGWELSARFVDVVIALSVVLVAVVGLAGPPRDWRLIGLPVFGFGLIHGLGLATRLHEAGIPDDGLVAKVIAFNIGIEIGQLAALGLMVLAGLAFARAVRDPERFKPVAFATMIVAGLVAATLLFEPSDDATDGPEIDPLAGTSCTRGPAPAVPASLEGGHPPRRFVGPGERFSEQDLEHVNSDGFVIIRYDPQLPRRDVRRLADWLRQVNPRSVAAPDPKAEAPLRAHHFEASMACSEFDLAGLTAFMRDWMGPQSVPDSALRN